MNAPGKGWTIPLMLMLLTVSFLPFIGSSEAALDDKTIDLILETPIPVLDMEDGITVISVEGWGSSSVPGEVALPEKTYYIPIGSDSDPVMKGFELIGSGGSVLRGDLRKVPFMSVDGSIPEVPERDGSDPVEILGTVDVDGNIFLMIRYSPFGIEGDLLTYPERTIVTLEVSGPVQVGSFYIPSDLPDPTVDDVEWTGPVWEKGPLPSITVAPGAVYHIQEPPVECLIITSSTFNSTLQNLATWKSQRGVYTKVIETSYIYSNWNGVDNQEKIRNCIKDYYTNESLEWVILGGDNAVVPARMAYIPDGYGETGSDGTTVPADGYYGDLTGTGHTPYDWDGDNDGNFGEYSVDGIDLSMEVFVGRLSTTSSTTMTSLVNNILNYEKNPPAGNWFNRTVLAGAFSNFIESSTKPQTDEAKLKEAIRTDFLDNGNYNNYTLYEGSGIVPSSYYKNASLSTTNLVNAITPGAFMVNLAGHGSNTAIYRTIWNSDSNSNGYCDSGESGSQSYFSTSSSPSNGGKKPLFYNDACNNGNFDTTWCLTEDILRDAGIGAVGSARVSWYAVGWTKGSDGGWYNQGHDYRFWEQFFNGAYQPGKALALSHSDYISDKTAHDKYCWKNLLQYNLMGDPEVPIWTQNPSTFNVTYLDPVPTPGNYQFTVKDGSGNPVQGATVCLMNGSVFYGEAVTDAQGKATMNMPSLAMQATLTVAKRNFIPFSRTVNVGKDDEPPRMGMVAAGGEWSTGDDFDLSAFVTDNVAVTGTTIRYGYGSSVPTAPTNVSMVNGGSYWSFSGTHPSSSLDPFWFSIGATDASGNWNHTSWTYRNITDNDDPVLLSDNTSFSVTTGDPVSFGCIFTDNIATSGAVVNYTFDDVVWNLLPMTGSGESWSAGMVLSSDNDAYIRYHFNLSDTSGNHRVTGNYYRDILDNDKPVMVSDNTILPPTTGNSTIFNISAADNIEIFRVRLIYREQGQGEMNYSMSTTDGHNFTYTMSIPSNRAPSVQYHYFIVDTAGNQVHTDTVNTAILDDDLPGITGVYLPPVLTTGDPSRFVVNAFDNIGVHEVKAVMDHPGRSGEVLNGTYNSTSGKWDIDFTAPSHLTGNANIRFLATDAAGNTYTSIDYLIPVIDNDLPVLIEDMTDDDAYCLETFEITVEVDDNVAIEEVRLFISDLLGSIVMEQTGGDTYSATRTVPGSIEPFHYHVEVEDTSGNVLVTETVSINVIDLISPDVGGAAFLWVNLTGEELSNVTTGEVFTIVSEIHENDQLNRVDVEILFPGVVNTTILEMTRARLLSDPVLPYNWSADVSMPGNLTGTVSYRFLLGDRSGNNFISEWFTMELIDNDAPELSFEEGDTDIETDSEQYYTFNARDNVGIVDARIWIPEHPDAVFEPQLNTRFLIVRVLLNDAFPTSTLHLHAEVSDGNLSTESIVTLNLIDRSPPDVTFVEIPDEVEVTGNYSLRVTITDNVGWSDPSARWYKVNEDLTVESQEIPLSPIVGLGAEASLQAPGTGLWILNFSVSDENGNLFFEEFRYEISDDIEPVAQINVWLDDIASGQVMELDGSNTTDHSDIVTYTWTITKPDGTRDVHTGETFQYKPNETGEYKVELEVVDEFGNRAKTSTTITVTPVDDDEDDPSDGWLLVAIISGSLIFLIIVLLAVFLAIRKGGKKEEELTFDEETAEEAESWEV